MPLVIEHLRTFADQISVLDDHSTDGTLLWLQSEADEQLAVEANPGESFDQHEGHVRQRLLSFTLTRGPTHVLAIDADEFIGDGLTLRTTLDANPEVASWTLQMHEVWNATPDAMQIRVDGAWRPYQRVHLWRAPDRLDRTWQIPERKLACPPVPLAALQARPSVSGQPIYHFGWTDPATRQARYERYMRLDAGRFHARAHLQSIVAPEHRIGLNEQPWPDAPWVESVKEKLLP